MEKWLKYAPPILFCLYLIKLATTGGGYQDVLAILVTASLVAVSEFQLKSKKIAELDQQIADLNLKLDESKKDIESVRSFITSQKLGQIRTNVNAR